MDGERPDDRNLGWRDHTARQVERQALSAARRIGGNEDDQ
jgi:hypothetical protein